MKKKSVDLLDLQKETTNKTKNLQTYGFHKGTNFRANMQAFGGGGVLQ